VIDLGSDRSSLINALGRVSAVSPTSPITFFSVEDVVGRVQALEARPPARGDHTAVVIGGLVLFTLLSLVALLAWLW
jgi:hypothetical protein